MIFVDFSPSGVTLLKSFPVVTFSRRFCIEWHLEGFPCSDICGFCLEWHFWKAFPESDICRRLSLGWHFWKAFLENICRRLCLGWHYWKAFPAVIFVDLFSSGVTSLKAFPIVTFSRRFCIEWHSEGFPCSDICRFCLEWHFLEGFPWKWYL